MKFRTEITPEPSSFHISHTQKTILFGSCFAESIGDKLLYYKFPIMVNPFGILFNPTSIRSAIQFICDKHYFEEDELIYHDGLYHSLFHHGSFSNADKKACVQNINAKIDEAYNFFTQATDVIITLGTAHVWEHKKSGETVANCHKMPASEFESELLAYQFIEDDLTHSITCIRKINPKARILFTISPIRYLKDGADANFLGKATMRHVIEEMSCEFENIHYFPAYEIMMDDLRDYRFYAPDMIHPTNQAIDYIWEKFAECYFDAATVELNKKIGAYQKALSHNFLHEDNPSKDAFLDHILSLKQSLLQSYPYLKL